VRPPSLGDHGLGWATAERWQARARLASAPSFNARLAEADGVDAIKALIAEASLQARRARGRGDAAGEMIAVAQRKAARRRGGKLLLASRDNMQALEML
jgi:hypothetical protein